MNASLTPELEQLIRRKLAEGMADAKAGRLVDGEEAFDRLRKRIDAHRKKPRLTSAAEAD